MPQEHLRLKKEEKPREGNVGETNVAEEQQQKEQEAQEQKTKEELEQERLQEEQRLQEQRLKEKAVQILLDAQKDKELRDIVDRYRDLDPWQIMQETQAEIVWKQKEEERTQQDLQEQLQKKQHKDREDQDEGLTKVARKEEEEKRNKELAEKQEQALTQEKEDRIDHDEKRTQEERTEEEQRQIEPDQKKKLDLETFMRENDEQETRVQAIEENKDKSAWQAVQNIDYESGEQIKDERENEERKIADKEVAADPIKRSYEEHESKRDSENKLALSHYAHEEKEQETAPNKEIEKQEEHEQRFSCYVPADVAHKLAELGPLEPETMKYLHKQYGYIERHVSEHDQQSQQHGFSEAAEHAQETLLPRRDDLCPERHERAELQIEQLELAKQEGQPSYIQEHMEITYKANDKNASYEMEEARPVNWERTELPPAMQKTLEERDNQQRQEELEQTLELIERDNARHKNSLDTRRAILVNEERIKQHEHEIEHIKDEEPAPMIIYTMRGGYVCRVYEAHNLEEFDRYDADVPPTPECLAAILDLDRRWKLWRGRVEREELDLHNARSNQYMVEYEHDDYDR